MKHKDLDTEKILETINSLPEDYWKKRYEAHDKRRVQSNYELESVILFILDECLEDIYDYIYTFYGKYAENGIVTNDVAYVKMTTKELLDLIGFFGRVLKEAGDSGIEFDTDILESMQSITSTSDLTRIAGLSMKIRARVEYCYGTIMNRSKTHMKDIIDDAYLTSIYEVFKATGYSSSENLNDLEDNIPFLFYLTWRISGESYDDVIWRYKREMEFNLDKQIKQNSFLGYPVERLLEMISGYFRRDNKNLKAMVETDSTFYSTLSQEQAFEDLEIEECLYCTIDDERRTEICAEADGNIIPVEDIEPWVNAPPLHYGCRSWLTPIISKVDFLTGDIEEMTDDDYETWYKENI